MSLQGTSAENIVMPKVPARILMQSEKLLSLGFLRRAGDLETQLKSEGRFSHTFTHWNDSEKISMALAIVSSRNFWSRRLTLTAGKCIILQVYAAFCWLVAV